MSAVSGGGAVPSVGVATIPGFVEGKISERLGRARWLTIGVTLLWIVAVVGFRVNVGLAAVAAGTALIVLRAADEKETIRGVPLDVILMVCGVSMLISLLETT